MFLINWPLNRNTSLVFLAACASEGKDKVDVANTVVNERKNEVHIVHITSSVPLYPT